MKGNEAHVHTLFIVSAQLLRATDAIRGAGRIPRPEAEDAESVLRQRKADIRPSGGRYARERQVAAHG
ncbi:Uncharacterised protein [Chlamydia trachomatis]|nr:Uncharacterised protein [Chlamydia trachomatis]